jgi:hypothetical protein
MDENVRRSVKIGDEVCRNKIFLSLTLVECASIRACLSSSNFAINFCRYPIERSRS